MAVRIGRCKNTDIDEVVRFIGDHWKAEHILTTCRPLLDWQYRDADGAGYSFIIARRATDRAVVGILGYIATQRFDPSVANVVWLTTWKARGDAGLAGVGIQLLEYLDRIEPHVAIGAVGLTPATAPLYRAFGYTVGELQHYVRPNPRADRSELATLPFRSTPIAPPAQGGRAARLFADEDFSAVRFTSTATSVPVKSAEYFRRRYGHHPIYRYIVSAIDGPGSAPGLIAARVVEHSGRKALRIVDFAGPPETFAAAGWFVDSLLEEFQAEYADIYNAGIPEPIFENAGFVKVDPDGAAVVPDHFEPFERRNVRLWYAIKGAPAVLFKGDGDQDRPNQVTGACG